jgi:exopolysaccharide biosynthesis polyprenyl glycosylphosphotransferase
MNKKKIRNITIAADLILMNAGFALAYTMRYNWQVLRPILYYEPYTAYLAQQFVLVLLLVFTFSQTGVWQRRRGEFWIDEVARIAYATAAAIGLMIAITFFVQPTPFSRLLFAFAFMDIVLLISLFRLVRRWALNWLYKRGRLNDRVLVLGSGEVGRSVIRTLLARPDLGFQAIGYLHDGHSENNIGLGRIPNVGTFNDLERILHTNRQLHTVFIAMPGERHGEITRALQICQANNIRAQVVPDLLQMSMNRVEMNNMAGIPTLRVRDVGISHSQLLLKRLLDYTLIFLLSIPALLLAGAIVIAIKLESPGPVLYTAQRIGKDGRPFTMYKFRSMIVGADVKKQELMAFNEADGPIFKMKDDPRMTKVGRTIRRLSLDELPQLINVLRGQMSLVGPRPPLPEEVAEYKPWHMQRLSVIGGITGLWQVSGRSDLTFDELCLLDIYYIENWSVGLDIRIMLQTIPHALSGRGAY